MNTQEHIKNCKECGKGFYHQGLDICLICAARLNGRNSRQFTIAGRQDYLRTIAKREAENSVAINLTTNHNEESFSDQWSKNQMEAIKKSANGLRFCFNQIQTEDKQEAERSMRIEADTAKNTATIDEGYDHFELSDIFMNRLCWFVSGMTVAFILDWLF